MNTEQQQDYLLYGEVIGRYRDCEIYKTVAFDGVVYEYDRLAKVLPDGRIDLGQVKPGEAFVKPGLVYKAAEVLTEKPEPEPHSTSGESMAFGAVENGTNNPHVRLSLVLGRLTGMYAFHWWRIATLRPEFGLLSDRKENVFVFAILYWSLGLTHWALVAEKTLSLTLANLVVSMALTIALTVRPKQSFSLAASLLAANAAVELLVLIANVLGVTFVGDWFYIFIEVLMYVTSLRAFHHAPSEVRERGYKYQKPSVAGFEKSPD